MEERGQMLRIIDVHADGLLTKGYTERQLESSEPEGTFIKTLTDKFQEKVNASFKTSKDRHFSISLSGRVGDNKEPIKFEFYYEHVLYPTRLSLNSMQAEFKGDSVTYEIRGNLNRDLPTTQTVHQYFKLQAARRLAASMTARELKDRHRSLKH